MEILINNLYICWVFLFVFSILYIIYEGYYFVRAVIKEDTEYTLLSRELIRLGVALSYFLSYIIWLIN